MLRRRATMGLGLLGAALAAGVGGCTEDAASIVVVCVAVESPEEDGCVTEPDVEACDPRATWNVAGAIPYTATLLVQSGLVGHASDVPLRAETNNVNLTEMVVTLRTPSGGRLGFTTWPNPFTLKVAGFVPVGGLGLSKAELIPEVYIKQIREAYRSDDEQLRQIVADVEIHGRTQGQEEIVVSDWSWPINLYDVSVDVDDELCTIPGEDPLCGDALYRACQDLE